VSVSVRPRLGGRGRGTARERPPQLVSLVQRFIIGQALMSGAIGLAYNRRNVPWLLVMVLLAVLLYLLATLVRSGTHAAWAAAVASETVLSAIGLYRFIFYGRYVGGTLLALITFGILIHPAVGRAFSAPSRRARAGFPEPALAEVRLDPAEFGESRFDEPGEQRSEPFGEGATS
jgi:hypothetical protein